MPEPTLLISGSVTPYVDVALHRLDQAIAEAIDDAVAQGVPQGLIVALLHGHTFQQTQRMVENA